MVTNNAQLDETTRVSLAMQAIYDIFGVSLEVIRTFDNDEDRSWMLAIAIFWAQHQLRNRMLPNTDLVIRVLVYSFVKCSSQVQEEKSGR